MFDALAKFCPRKMARARWSRFVVLHDRLDAKKESYTLAREPLGRCFSSTLDLTGMAITFSAKSAYTSSMRIVSSRASCFVVWRRVPLARGIPPYAGRPADSFPIEPRWPTD